MALSDKPVILIVDDDKNTRDGLQRALQRHYTVLTAEGADAALAALGGDRPVDVMLSDLRMPGTDGLGLLRRAVAQHPQTVCILLTAYGSVETAVDAMKQGAYDFLTKPVNLDHLDMLVARALKSRDLETKVASLESQLNEKFGMENIIGESDAMKQMFEIIRQTAPTQASVLIQGASGTGKELVAQAIHRLSARAKGPFVAVHCAALSATLLESELFGHEKGAFTGAAVQRKGRFELADGGTLVLDEISEIDPSIQVKLLRVLEDRTFERVGGEATVETDIRLIAATNRDLRGYVAQGKFREDLYFRLNVVDITLPSLAERTGDIPLLADRFLKEYCEKNGKRIEGMTPDAMALLTAYAWPGNVRELRNTIEKMVVLSRADRLTARDVPANIRDEVKGPGAAAGRTPGLATGSLAETERQKIMAVLERSGGHRTNAARELGISRRTLHRKLREYQELNDGANAQNGETGL
ncbi:MAG: sigma-54 dependent transcriptional regulator [Verrucomicrobiota bacterium]|jgi:DNA-binding NtrC family response regulator|nr:sigma-54 dependent transcriptional regulator [Verrucomicrobiota bacterium]